MCLAAAVQGLNNARAVIVGSQYFFSNDAFASEGFGNKEAASDLLTWVFQKAGVVRVRNMYYHG